MEILAMNLPCSQRFPNRGSGVCTFEFGMEKEFFAFVLPNVTEGPQRTSFFKPGNEAPSNSLPWQPVAVDQEM